MQEMMDIVKAIYDMMGKYTYPVLRDDTPRQHVDVFFQVCTPHMGNGGTPMVTELHPADGAR